MTKEQAGAAWRPMSRGSPTDAGARCIADKCAMWRWGETRRTFEQKVIQTPPNGRGDTRCMIQAPVDTPTRGYCGLAGSPVQIS